MCVLVVCLTVEFEFHDHDESDDICEVGGSAMVEVITSLQVLLFL